MKLGVWRGVAGISASCLSWSIANWLSKRQFNKFIQMLISFGILGAIFVITSNAILYPCSQQDFLSILFIILLVALSLSEKSFLYKWYKPRVGEILRKISQAVFLLAGCGWTFIREIEKVIMGEIIVEAYDMNIFVYYVNTIVGICFMALVAHWIEKALKKIALIYRETQT